MAPFRRWLVWVQEVLHDDDGEVPTLTLNIVGSGTGVSESGVCRP